VPVNTPREGTAKNGDNTQLAFCRVRGEQFWRMTPGYAATDAYAVLKLGKYCPKGATEIKRFIDNEDDDNRNSASGPYAPNISTANTTLVFCYFAPLPPFTLAAPVFPELGVPYAVFSDFDTARGGLAKRWVRSDDEDDDNRDLSTTSSGTVPAQFEAMVGGAENTMFDMLRVR
jgi:hypothetical protein